MGRTDGPSVFLQSVDRAVELITLLAKSQTPQSVIQLSSALNINRTTTYGLINTLLVHRLIQKDELSNKYTIGPKLFELGSMYKFKLPFTSVAEKISTKLVEKWNLTVYLAIYDTKGNILIVMVKFPVNTLVQPLGYVSPAYATSLGKMLLSAVPLNEIDDMLADFELEKHTAKTITDKNALKAELAVIRERGYATDREEFVGGLSCVAAPIKDFTGKTIAAISLSGSMSRVLESEQAIIEDVTTAAKKISQELGWHEF